jgi:Domain of unknown function (DUF4276)
MQIGFAVEDRSDAEVIEVILRRFVNDSIRIKPYIGSGCGKIKAKCAAWAQHAFSVGCRVFVVVQDLDDRNERELRLELERSVASSRRTKNIIVVPVREIEAWLLSDEVAIGRLVGKNKVKQIANPEAILRPKEKLREIIRVNSLRKIYYLNTVHNVKIARLITRRKLERCSSVKPLLELSRHI